MIFCYICIRFPVLWSHLLITCVGRRISPGFFARGFLFLSQRFSHEIICVFQIHQTSS